MTLEVHHILSQSNLQTPKSQCIRFDAQEEDGSHVCYERQNKKAATNQGPFCFIFSNLKVNCKLAVGIYKALIDIGNILELSQQTEMTKLTVQTSKSCRTLWFMSITEIVELLSLKVV